MVRPAKETAKVILLLVLVLFLADCANQLPPGGGDIDRIPPEITELYPPDGTLNYGENYIEVTFSEYVEKRTVREAIFISPALEGNIELNWSGRSVRVKFPGKLRENTTYNITIGTDVQDLNNRNRMNEAYNFSFSTGTQLDVREITGRIFTEKPQGIFLFAYLNPEDTLDPSKQKPVYISQSGVDGRYRMKGLSAGLYRIFAVQDEFRDLFFNAEQDRIGIPFKEVILNEEDTLYAGLDYFMTMLDTIRPRMLTSVMTDINHVLLSFSEELDSTSISSRNFRLIDSTTNTQINPLYAYKNINKPTEIILSIKNNLTEDSRLFIFADTLRDMAGNIYTAELNSVTFTARADTIKPSLLHMHPPSGNTISDFRGQIFSFGFNDGIDSSIVKKNTSLADTSGKKIKFRMWFSDDANFRITPAEILEPSKDYIINFDLSNVSDAAGNRSDTVLQYRFRTISGLDFTGLSGRVDNAEFTRNPTLVLQGIDEKKVTYQKNINTSEFLFDRIEPGTYRLWSYYDEDSSSTYTKGWPYPFSPSEEFIYYRDSLLLRPRWAITDIKFDLSR
jgi:hypothetical protein